MPKNTISDEFSANASLAVDMATALTAAADQVIETVANIIPATLEYYTNGKNSQEAGFDIGFC